MVLVETSDGALQVHDSVLNAIVALTRRKAKPADWILVKKVDAPGHKWMYVPDLVKSIQENRFNSMSVISENDEMTDDLKRDPLLRSLDAQSLEIVFASMKRSSSTSSTLLSSSLLTSSMCSAGSRRHSSSLEGRLPKETLRTAHPRNFSPDAAPSN
jgi:hypothetical protein